MMTSEVWAEELKWAARYGMSGDELGRAVLRDVGGDGE